MCKQIFGCVFKYTYAKTTKTHSVIRKQVQLLNLELGESINNISLY